MERERITRKRLWASDCMYNLLPGIWKGKISLVSQSGIGSTQFSEIFLFYTSLLAPTSLRSLLPTIMII